MLIAAVIGLIGNFFILKGQVDRSVDLSRRLESLTDVTITEAQELQRQANETVSRD
jgi:hypothetical protein